MAIPSRIIEGILNSEIDPQKYYSLYGKENIENELKKLRQSNDEILNKYTPQKVHKAMLAKMNKKKVLPFTGNFSKIITYAAAAVFIAAIVVPVGILNSKANTVAPTARVKGSSSKKESNISLYRKNGREIQSLQDGTFVHEGDVIQIAYQAGQNDYGLIFSVDGNGNITRHFPENGWTAQELKHGPEDIPLDFSYELDNAPDFECFVFVTSKKPFSFDKIQTAIKDKTNIDYLRKLSYLPAKTTAVTFVLEK